MAFEVLLFIVGALAGLFVGAEYARRRPTGSTPERTHAPTDAPVRDAPAAPPSSDSPPTVAPSVDATTADAAPTLSSLERLDPLREPLEKAYDAHQRLAGFAAEPVFQQAVELLAAPDVPLDTVVQYAVGTPTSLSCAALAALPRRPDVTRARRRLLEGLSNLGGWALQFAFPALVAADPAAPIGSVFVIAPEFWAKTGWMLDLIRAYMKQARAGGAPVGFGDVLAKASPEHVTALEALLNALDDENSRALLDAMRDWQRTHLDRKALLELGRFVEPVTSDPLCEFAMLRDPLTTAVATLAGEPPRSVVVVGEARSGKSSFIRLIAAELAPEGYVLFEASGSDLMSGQIYIGQLEQRVQQLLKNLATGKRALWYAPDLMQLAMAGSHRSQPASLLDQVLPAILDGKIVLVSEATPAQMTKLLQLKPALRSALQVIRLPTPSAVDVESATLIYAGALARATGIAIAPDVAQRALQLARQYFNAQQGLGGALDFLKLAAVRASARVDATELTSQELLETLSQVTGLPRSILDDGARIDLGEVRAFFNRRVIGQPTAVTALVDRVAMLKSGLTDPQRPIGVFLFAGPTGTGKTELAKTLTEYLFGSGDRMFRLDMSEFQSLDSTRKIIGDAGEGTESESLTARVRKQPFCVVLLDEFEKAHQNIWDLFLQVFDDGRLTDANGHTVDFRHAIVILTTNLGATAHKGGNMGFTGGASAFTDAQIQRAVQQNFRPEFVNRIDRVIVFQPLSRDRMREILQKELRRVLERRGFKAREWAVEWESSAIEFLLDVGFTPDMGARPLRRAIDQYLLAPLAATLVEHRFPEGEQFLFVRSNGRELQVEFVDPDADDAPTQTLETDVRPEGSIEGTILQATGNAAERALLRRACDDSRQAVDSSEFEARIAELAAAMRAQDFWESTSRFDVLARYSLHDRLRAALSTAEALQGRVERSVRDGQHSRPIAARCANQLYVVRLGLDDASGGIVSDAVLTVAPALEAGVDPRAVDAWCARLLTMYRSWADRRAMHVAELKLAGRPALVVSGFGAWRIVEAEAGLHVLEQDGVGGPRITARVQVAAEPPTDPAQTSTRLAVLAAKLARGAAANDVVRRYRDGDAPLVRDARQGWRTGRLDLVLDGHFDLLGAALAATP
jgi:ATP-dependent Clp protease ATP-binding subunit ClpC